MKKQFAFVGLLFLALTGAAQDLLQLRYYFNETAENMTYVSVGSLQELDANFEINVAGLPQGVHQLYIELQNSAGIWTHYDRIAIQVAGGLSMFTLNSFEYFFDEDPGYGNGIQVDVSGESFDGNIPLSVAGLSNGIHRVYYRFRDGAIQWSHYDSQVIQVTLGGYEELVRLEYFFDIDPGIGNAPGINFDQTPTLDLEAEIVVPEFLTLGQHILYVRLQDTSGQWSHYGQDTLTVCDIVTPEITASGTFCAGDTVELSTQEGYTSYVWSSGSDSNTTEVTESGIYSLTVNDEDCAITVTTEIQFTELPMPVIVADGNTMSVEEGDYTYEWTFNGVVVPDNNGPSLEGTSNGTAVVTISSGECSATSEPFDFTYIGIDEIRGQTFYLYPNPADGLVTIQTTMPGELFLIDATGKTILTEKLTGNQLTLDLTSMANGLYVVQYRHNAGVTTGKLQLNH